MDHRKWVVYSTFDAAGATASHAVEQLEAYHALGFATVVVDTSPCLSAERERDWRAASTLWLKRPNVGYDFGSYKKGAEVLGEVSAIPVESLTILFANDSCYGPYTPLKAVFDRFDAHPLGAKRVFGITDSDESGHHLQSYFLYFRPEVMRHALQFFAEMPHIENKADAIKYGELQFSKFLKKQGCELVSLCSTAQIVGHFLRFRSLPLAVLELAIRRYRRLFRYTKNGDLACMNSFLEAPYLFNPMTAFGTHLFFAGMTPFLKRELIRDNPNFDSFVPDKSRFPQFDNATVARVLKSTPEYQRRYGRYGRAAGKL